MPPTKQDIISRVYNSVMHILHDSHLYDSSLWPKNGFIPGYGTEFTKSDTSTVGISISQDKETMKYWQSVCINIINKKPNRSAKQAEAIFLILHEAIYDNIHFEGPWNKEIPEFYNYRARNWIREGMAYSQLVFKFTINN